MDVSLNVKKEDDKFIMVFEFDENLNSINFANFDINSLIFIYI